jgi:tape measure domain-containing protein
MDREQLASLGLTVDDSGALRALSRTEQAAIRMAMSVEKSAKGSSDAYVKWWEAAARQLERAQQRDAQVRAEYNTRQSNLAVQAAQRQNTALQRDYSALQRALAQMEARTQREIRREADIAYRERIARERAVERTAQEVARERERIETELARTLIRLEREVGRAQQETLREREQATAAISRSLERLEQEVARANEQAAKEQAQYWMRFYREREQQAAITAREEARVQAESERNGARILKEAARQQQQAARERERVAQQAAREQERAEKESAREVQAVVRDLNRAFSNAARQRERDEREAARQVERQERETARQVQQQARETARAQKESAKQREQAERDAAQNARNAWSTFKLYLTTLLGGFGAREVLDEADAYKLLNSRIGITATSEQARGLILNRLYEISNKTRSDIESTALLYTRMAFAGENLTHTQNQLLRVTQSVNEELIIAGASSREAAGAAVQLAHGFSENTLQGRQLLSLLMNAPLVAQAIAQGMGVQVGELRRLARESKLTGQVIFDALGKNGEQIDAQFAKMPVTVGQAFVVLRNHVSQWIGQMDSANKTTAAISHGIVVLSQNITGLVNALGKILLAYVAYIAYTRTAAILTAALPIIRTVLAFLRLAAAIRSAADAEALFAIAGNGVKAALGGPIGIIALLVTAALTGFTLYKIHAAEAAAANEEFKASLSNLGVGELMIQLADYSAKLMDVRDQIRALGGDKPLTTAEANRAVNRSIATQVIPGLGAFLPPIRDPRLPQLREQEREFEARVQAIKDQMKAIDEMNRQLRGHPVDPEAKGDSRKRALIALNEQLEEARRAAEKGLQLSQLEGMAAQEAAIQDDAHNNILKFKARLLELVASRTITQADATQLLIKATETYNQVANAQTKAMQQQEALKEGHRHADFVRQTQQEIDLSTRSGLAQELLRIRYDAVNKSIEARRTLTGAALQKSLENIVTEERMSEQLAIYKRVASDIGQTFQQTWQRIVSGGITKFSQLFTAIKELFIRTIGEMMEEKFMATFGRKLVAMLSGGLSYAMNAGAAAQAIVTSTAGAAGSSAAGPGSAVGGSINSAVQLAGIAAFGNKASPQTAELMKAFARYATGAAVGAMVGGGVGYGTGSALGGAAAGGLSGAATGFAFGGPVGAIVGGIVGVGAGLLGAHKKHQEEERARQALLRKNNEKLAELRESINGSPLMSGRNLANALPFLHAILTGPKFGTLTSALQGGKSGSSLSEVEKQYGISAQELGRIAQSMGIELFDSKGKLVAGALDQLNQALQLTIKAATQFSNSLDDIQKRQEAYNKLFHVADTPANKLKDAFEILQKLSPELVTKMGLNNVNLATAEGRQILLKGLQDIFNLINSGALTPDLLGSFTDKNQLIDAILAASDALDAFKGAVNEVTTDFPKAMDLALYVQRHGTSLPASGQSSASTSSTTNSTVVFSIENLNVQNNAEDTPIELTKKVEQGARQIALRGGFTMLPNAKTSRA